MNAGLPRGTTSFSNNECLTWAQPCPLHYVARRVVRRVLSRRQLSSQIALPLLSVHPPSRPHYSIGHLFRLLLYPVRFCCCCWSESDRTKAATFTIITPSLNNRLLPALLAVGLVPMQAGIGRTLSDQQNDNEQIFRPKLHGIELTFILVFAYILFLFS